MPLPTDYVGTSVTWPLKVTPQSASSHKRADSRAPVSCVPSVIMKATFTDPPTVAVAGIGSDAGPNATTVAFTIDGALSSGGTVTFASPTCITATVTHGSSVVAQTLTLNGTDQYGNAITEVLDITAGGTSKTDTSSQAFKTLTSATQTAAGNASANTAQLGNSKTFGLPFRASCVVPVCEQEDGVAVATAGVIVRASTAASTDTRGLYTPNGTPNGSKDWEVWYISDDLSAI